LARVGEDFGCTINFQPKPIKGDWNGSGCHTNFSTTKTRGEGGLEYIREHCMKVLEEKHAEHLKLYGTENELRLTGKHETASAEKFTYGMGNRGASCRVPVMTVEGGKGYFEDRRPGSNIDPYLVSGIMVDTVCLGSKYCKELLEAY
jgi:glutamine synthetase